VNVFAALSGHAVAAVSGLADGLENGMAAKVAAPNVVIRVVFIDHALIGSDTSAQGIAS
jgi:hypothetical protein